MNRKKCKKKTIDAFYSFFVPPKKTFSSSGMPCQQTKERQRLKYAQQKSSMRKPSRISRLTARIYLYVVCVLRVGMKYVPRSMSVSTSMQRSVAYRRETVRRILVSLFWQRSVIDASWMTVCLLSHSWSCDKQRDDESSLLALSCSQAITSYWKHVRHRGIQLRTTTDIHSHD